MEAAKDCCVKFVLIKKICFDPYGKNFWLRHCIRPLSEDEKQRGCQDCVTVTPSKPQVQIGAHSFTYDHVYGSTGSPSSAMFKECVSPLVDGLFKGYNATVLAYGQTGSGKTYTMGTGIKDGLRNGIVPQVMNALFGKIHKEEVIDLLGAPSKLECGNGTATRAAVLGKAPIQIRESSDGVIRLAGSIEVSVNSLNEMDACLEQGCLNRVTGSTNMNNQSSRSHAIFSITLEQRWKHRVSGNMDGSSNEEYLCAKLHLVDLAGSERVNRTCSDGLRFKEGVHINKGLFALGNVISTLGDKKKHKGVYVPYRDSKLTRLLQDSLGGNSRTLMVACISPADISAEETLNTLKYANRTRNIQNKPVVNRGTVSCEMLKLRQQLEVLQAELSARGERVQPEKCQGLNERIASLKAENESLSQELHVYRSRCAAVEYSATSQDDERLVMRSECLKGGLPDRDSIENPMPVITGEIREVDRKEKEWEHKVLQTRLDKQLDQLNNHIQQDKSEMKHLGGSDSETLRQHYGRKVMDLENERRAMQQDGDQLLTETESHSSSTDPRDQKLKLLEAQILDLKRQLENQVQLLKQKEKSDEATKHLQEEIQIIKGQKVQLQHKMKQEAEQYRQWKASREKELLQLRRDGRRNEFERHKLQALNQRQKLVLQRKTEEAAVATKRLKELLEVKKSSGRDHAALAYGHDASTQSDKKHMQCWLDHELEVMMHAHEVRSEYKKQSEYRAALAEELSNLQQLNKYNSEGLTPTNGSDRLSSVSSMSPNACASRIFSLKSMLNTSSNSLMAMASQLSEAEERERTLFSSERWNQMRSVEDAKQLLQYMFANLYDARCQLWDRDMEIKEMNEKMEELVNLVRQNETQRQEVEKKLEVREQEAALGDSHNSMKNFGDEVICLSLVRSRPAQKQLKYVPGIEDISMRESTTFVDLTKKIVPAESTLSMKKSTTKRQIGKPWSWKKGQHQLLLQCKWKWEMPWKLSEWIKHSDETFMRPARPPSPQA